MEAQGGLGLLGHGRYMQLDEWELVGTDMSRPRNVLHSPISPPDAHLRQLLRRAALGGGVSGRATVTKQVHADEGSAFLIVVNEGFACMNQFSR